jgi:hypothetical protein
MGRRNILKASVSIVPAWLFASQLFMASACLAEANGEAALYDPASAGFIVQGCRDFLAADTTSQQRWSAAICVGKVMTLDADSMFLSPPLHACTFKAASPTDLVRAIVNHFDANPSRLTEPFSALALEALAQTWPCPDHATQ